jgi:hypothetical protein
VSVHANLRRVIAGDYRLPDGSVEHVSDKLADAIAQQLDGMINIPGLFALRDIARTGLEVIPGLAGILDGCLVGPSDGVKPMSFFLSAGRGLTVMADRLRAIPGGAYSSMVISSAGPGEIVRCDSRQYVGAFSIDVDLVFTPASAAAWGLDGESPLALHATIASWNCDGSTPCSRLRVTARGCSKSLPVASFAIAITAGEQVWAIAELVDPGLVAVEHVSAEEMLNAGHRVSLSEDYIQKLAALDGHANERAPVDRVAS